MDSHFCHQNSSSIFECQNRRCSAVKVGRGERFAAEVGPAEGGEASLSELCIAFCRISSTPCYLLAEVRRILRATPTAAGPSSDRHSVFLIGFWRYFSVFWDRFLMISGSNLGGLPLPEHLWDLLAAAGGSPML